MPEGYIISVRVTPRAARDELIGWQDGELRVRLRAPPVEGQANEALRRFVARLLDLPVSGVALVHGATSRTKRLRLKGVSEEEVLRRLGLP